ncbi:hypothetical protein JOB18_014027 [Solea senegalensis]|uniref:Uncharacterized protein n=1 Tax=Solea senegalensis TaxID=28829 RepID=A0AAV6QS09_SOLSE|nr:hypothetical protein JOB18_014027 [Solea senegalensis]
MTPLVTFNSLQPRSKTSPGLRFLSTRLRKAAPGNQSQQLRELCQPFKAGGRRNCCECETRVSLWTTSASLSHPVDIVLKNQHRVCVVVIHRLEGLPLGF